MYSIADTLLSKERNRFAADKYARFGVISLGTTKNPEDFRVPRFASQTSFGTLLIALRSGLLRSLGWTHGGVPFFTPMRQRNLDTPLSMSDRGFCFHKEGGT